MSETATKTPKASSTPTAPLKTAPLTGKFVFSSWTDLPALEIEHQRVAYRQNHSVGFLERCVALLLLILVLPLLILIAIIMKIESPRDPIFYKQERVGLDRRKQEEAEGSRDDANVWSGGERRNTPREGQYFMVWKLRTMKLDAESKTGPVWASVNDPRVTRVGRVLRQLRLDELPQLINVFRGQMGLIGPRPERPHFVRELAKLVPEYRRRLQVRPGITGLAQVEREYDADVEDVKKKIGYDLFYVENRSRVLDLKILLKTIDVVFRGRGAH